MRTAVRISIVIAVMAALSLPSSTISAKPPTYVTHNCVDIKVEPNMIMFACGDGGFYVEDLDWRTWTLDRATARGTYYMNNCKPSCAGGEFRHRTGRLILKEKGWCPDIEQRVFMRARVFYDKPWRGDDSDTVQLFCPFS